MISRNLWKEQEHKATSRIPSGLESHLARSKVTGVIRTELIRESGGKKGLKGGYPKQQLKSHTVKVMRDLNDYCAGLLGPLKRRKRVTDTQELRAQEQDPQGIRKHSRPVNEGRIVMLPSTSLLRDKE